MFSAWHSAFGQQSREGNYHSVEAKMFYVDASFGNDTNDGCSPAHAWQSLAKVNNTALRPGDTVLFKRGGTWRGQLLPKSGGPSGPVTYTAYGAGEKPLLLGSVSRNSSGDWIPEGGNIWSTKMLDVMAQDPVKNRDVGNIVFDHGKATGVKKWKLDELQRPYDYWYDTDNQQVKLFSRENPTNLHSTIELALRRNIVILKDVHLAVFDGLALRYGAAHGFGGANTHDLVIRNCDISYIGGGHQFSRPDGQPVRFGNGIEFWGAAHDNLVEGCRIWEIYDAALSNQGHGPESKEENITYRNNVIWNAEYSFEYWNRPETAITENIQFINNTCANAGGGWAHSQRPDPNGSHLMFYSNTAATKRFTVKYNIFYNATDWGLRMENNWRGSPPDLDYNLWFQSQGIIAKFQKANLTATDFVGYRQQTGFDTHSIFVDPKFVSPAALNLRLAPDSPARSLRPDGGPVGALSLF